MAIAFNGPQQSEFSIELRATPASAQPASEQPSLYFDAWRLAEKIADKDNPYQADVFDAYKLADAFLYLQRSRSASVLQILHTENNELRSTLAKLRDEYTGPTSQEFREFRELQAKFRVQTEQITKLQAQIQEMHIECAKYDVRVKERAPEKPSPVAKYAKSIPDQIADFSASMIPGSRPYP